MAFKHERFKRDSNQDKARLSHWLWHQDTIACRFRNNETEEGTKEETEREREGENSGV